MAEFNIPPFQNGQLLASFDTQKITKAKTDTIVLPRTPTKSMMRDRSCQQHDTYSLWHSSLINYPQTLW